MAELTLPASLDAGHAAAILVLRTSAISDPTQPSPIPADEDLGLRSVGFSGSSRLQVLRNSSQINYVNVNYRWRAGNSASGRCFLKLLKLCVV